MLGTSYKSNQPRDDYSMIYIREARRRKRALQSPRFVVLTLSRRGVSSTALMPHREDLAIGLVAMEIKGDVVVPQYS